MTFHLTVDLVHSPLGDRREHPVPCQLCRRPTGNYNARCDTCVTETDPTYRAALVMERIAEHVARVTATGAAVPHVWSRHTIHTALLAADDALAQIAVAVETALAAHPSRMDGAA